VDDPGEDDNNSGLDDEQDDGVFGIVNRRIDMFKDTPLRRCPVGAGTRRSRRIDGFGNELSDRSRRHVSQ
jgi:hypothetical protein